MAVEFVAFVPTRAKTIEGLTRALYRWGSEWFSPWYKTPKQRVDYVRGWLGDGLDWHVGKGAVIWCI